MGWSVVPDWLSPHITPLKIIHPLENPSLNFQGTVGAKSNDVHIPLSLEADWNLLSLQALDLVPNDIHERSPIFLGSYEDVEEVKALYAAEDKK